MQSLQLKISLYFGEWIVTDLKLVSTFESELLEQRATVIKECSKET